MEKRARWKRKRIKKNILENIRMGNFSLTKSIFMLVSFLLVISYLITNLENIFSRQITKQTNMTGIDSSADIWDRIFSNVVGVDAKWSIQKDGKIKINFPYQRTDKKRRVIEKGSHVFYISPKFSDKMPIDHEIIRNMRDGSLKVEKGFGYISISEGKTFLQRGDISTVIKKSDKRWESEHRYYNKSLKQKEDLTKRRNDNSRYLR